MVDVTLEFIALLVVTAIIGGAIWDSIKFAARKIYTTNWLKLKPLVEPLFVLAVGIPMLGLFGGGSVMMLFNLYHGKTVYTLGEMFGDPAMMGLTLTAFLLISLMVWASAVMCKRGFFELLLTINILKNHSRT